MKTGQKTAARIIGILCKQGLAWEFPATDVIHTRHISRDHLVTLCGAIFPVVFWFLLLTEQLNSVKSVPILRKAIEHFFPLMVPLVCIS